VWYVLTRVRHGIEAGQQMGRFIAVIGDAVAAWSPPGRPSRASATRSPVLDAPSVLRAPAGEVTG